MIRLRRTDSFDTHMCMVRDVLTEYGISVVDADGSLRGLHDVISDLQSAWSKSETEDNVDVRNLSANPSDDADFDTCDLRSYISNITRMEVV